MSTRAKRADWRQRAAHAMRATREGRAVLHVKWAAHDASACICNKTRFEVPAPRQHATAHRDCYRPHPQPLCVCDACHEAKQARGTE